MPGLLACIENILICDPDLKKCRNYPETVDFKDKHESILYQWPRISDDKEPKPDLARALLFSSMRYSFIGLMMGNYDLKRNSHCLGIDCTNLSRVEARQPFEASLVVMQRNVLDIVRGKNTEAVNGEVFLLPTEFSREM